MDGNQKRRWLADSALLLAVAGSVALAGAEFPKYALRLLFFGFFLLADIALWRSYRFYLKRTRKAFINRCLKILYWLPLAVFFLYILMAYLQPVQLWPGWLRIYLPGLLVVLFLWKIVLVVFLSLSFLLALPFNLVTALRARGTGTTGWRQNNAIITSGLAFSTLLALLMLSGFVFWVYDFKVTQIEINSSDLPSGFDGIKIVQISDLHMGSWASAATLDKAVTLINAQHPDIVVFTGDIVNNLTSEAHVFEPQLKKIKAPLGTYAILGNHDYGDYIQWETPEAKRQNDSDLIRLYVKIGWRLLKNEHTIIHRASDSIALIGVENWSTHKSWGKRGNLPKAIQGVEKVKFKILLSHDPTHWRAEVLTYYPGIQLTLSGHTHAMQLGWELPCCRYSPAEWIFPEWAGLYEAGDTAKQFLYVNRGLGNLGFPGRVGIRPEITVLHLKRAK